MRHIVNLQRLIQLLICVILSGMLILTGCGGTSSDLKRSLTPTSSIAMSNQTTECWMQGAVPVAR